MVDLSSWGRLQPAPHTLVSCNSGVALDTLIPKSAPGIAYGMGRSYGDVCLSSNNSSWQTRALDRLIHFDAERGILHCESGVTLYEIQHLLLPRGWLLPVTPGTQWVTVGGAIANDVHGKNHHRYGTLGEHVQALTLIRTDGSIHTCSLNEQSDLFRATIGGLGLTGVIRDAKLRLRRVNSGWLETQTQTFTGLEDFFTRSAEADSDWEYSVAWIDCLSGSHPRGLLQCARHCTSAEKLANSKVLRRRQITLPFTPPISLVNRLTLKALNAVYYHIHSRRTEPLVSHFDRYLYPLDSINHWNRAYGPGGFFQFQCVIPESAAQQTMRELLATIQRSGQGSTLAVLKRFADRPAAGLLSFPMAGWTLALDFPNLGTRTTDLLTRLNSIAHAAGGRMYAAKDACMTAQQFADGYPGLPEFLPHRDPGACSDLSRRLLGS